MLAAQDRLVHAIVFGGFSAEAERRIYDCKSTVLITCDGTYADAKAVPLKTRGQAAEQCPSHQDGVRVKRPARLTHVCGQGCLVG